MNWLQNMFRVLRAATLRRYVLREFAVLFAVTLMATTGLMLLVLAIQLVTEFEQFGVSAGQMLLLAPYIMPRALVFALPPATMIAAIMVFGRMSAESEILAAQAGGAPMRVMTMPLFVIGLAISASSLWLQDTGVRWGNSQIRDVVLQINRPEDFIQKLDKPGNSFSIQSDAVTSVRVNLPAANGNRRPIQIVYFQNGSQGKTVFAEDHTFLAPVPATKTKERTLVVRLSGVQIFEDRTSYADEIDWGVPLPDIGSIIPIGNTRGQKSWIENKEIADRITRDEHARWEFLMRRASDFGALAAAGSTLDPSAAGMSANAWNTSKIHTEAIVGNGGALERMKLEKSEFHRKVALGLLPVAMVMLGMGLGLLVKKSNRVIGFLIGVGLYCIFYFPMTIIAKSLATGNQLGSNAWLAQYIPATLFLAGGFALCVGFERGHITALPGFLRWLTKLTMLWTLVVKLFKLFVGAIRVIVILPVKLFWRTADRYIASEFLVPLIAIIFSIAGFITFIDVIEHHTEIMDGITKCAEPLGSLPKRAEWEAVRDVAIYYGIQALDYTLDLLPFEVLIAGMLCAMVLVRNQEHLILKSSGMRLQRALMPVMVLAVIAGLGVSAAREFAMPTLAMHRDFLKPQIYHRTPQSSSFALYTFDDKKKPILCVIGQYEAATESGKDLCIYLLGDEKNKRIPTISAHVFKWDRKANSWELWTDPAEVEKALLAQKSFGGGGGKSPQAEPKKKTSVAQTTRELKRNGVYKVIEASVPPSKLARETNADTLKAVTVSKSQIASWSGPIDPKFINTERMGAKVMRLAELDALSEYKPALKVDFYRRISEFMLCLFILWCAMPLMFNDSTTSPWKAIVFAILFAGIYWGSCEFAATKARANVLPAWSALVPHAVFFVIGSIQYFKRLQT